MKPFKNIVSETYTEIVKCKYCDKATDVVRYGKSKGKQYYFCNLCGRKFLNNQAMPGMRVPIEAIGAAIGMFYEGMSLSAISRQLWYMYRVQPSRSTLHGWVMKYSKKADRLISDLKPKVGKTWIVDETVVKIGGQNTWFWDVIDDKTRFIIASHLSTSRGAKDAEAVMKRAQDKAEKPPRFIISDKLAAYLEGIERVFGADTWHLRSQGFTGEINTNLIERFHGTLKDRTKVMRGLKSRETAKVILSGYLMHYNFFRPHQTLKGKTPAEVAGIKFPHISWAGIIKSEKEAG